MKLFQVLNRKIASFNSSLKFVAHTKAHTDETIVTL